MELRVLGPLEVVHDGLASTFQRTHARRLLALLATRPNVTVSVSELIDELWDGNAPTTATSALRVHMSHIRRVLDPGNDDPDSESSRLTFDAGGYRLRLSTEEFDVARFENLAGRGRNLHLAGDERNAEDALAEALRCWRGPAFAEIRDLAAAQGVVARLDELRVATVEALAESRLERGEYQHAVDLLVGAVDDYPLHERLTGHLMLALYRSGRQADALRVFAELARRLDEQLALTPCQDLRQLEEDILLQREALEWDRPVNVPRVTPRARASVTRLIGRREELAQLIDFHREAASGTRKLVFVEGASGIGKTTLVNEFVERARTTGTDVFVGACSSPSQCSYEPVVQILSEIALQLDDASVSELASDLRGERPASHAFASARDADSSAEEFRLLEAITSCVQVSASRPVVLVVDDIQWADAGTTRVLRHLLRHQGLDHLMVVATISDEVLDAGVDARLARLARPTHVARIKLDGLDLHEMRALIRTRASAEISARLLRIASTLRDTTAGHPLAICELIREVEDQAAQGLSPDDFEEFAKAVAPQGVRLLVERRLQHLSADAIDVVRAASVLAHRISTPRLSSICARQLEEVHEALEEILDVSLLVEDNWHVDEFEFPHAAVCNVIYQGIDSDSRARLHYLAARALEPDSSPTPARFREIAYHYLCAEPHGDDALLVDAALRAARQEAEQLSFAEAARWYEVGLARWPAADRAENDRASVELELGHAYEMDHRYADAHRHFVAGARHALASGDAPLLADLALATSGPWISGLGDQAERQTMLKAALDQLGETDPYRRVRLLTSLASAFYFIDPRQQEDLALDAFDEASRMGDRGALVSALIAQHLALTHFPEQRAERLALAERAVDIADTQLEELRSRRELLTDLLENGHVQRFSSELNRYEETAKAAFSPRDIYWSMALRATEATLHGELGTGEQLARGALLRGRELHQESAGAELLQRFVIRFQQGRLAEEVGGLQNTAREADSVYRAGSCLSAVACSETGRVPEAVRITRWALGADGSALPRDAFWLGAHALFASVAASAGDVDLADQLDDALRPCAQHTVVFGAGAAMLGCVHLWLGELCLVRQQWAEAEEHLDEAIRTSQAFDAPYWSAHGQIDLALALRGRGASSARAIERLVDEAVSVSERKHYGRLLARASTLT